MARFSHLSFEARLTHLQEKYALSSHDIAFLKQSSHPDPSLAEAFIENAVGFYPLPLGLVLDVALNQKMYAVPLVTEETSVIAALQKTVRWVQKQKGTLDATSQIDPVMIGQIHIPFLKSPSKLQHFLDQQQNALILAAHQGPAHAMAKRGGGVKKLILRVLPRPDGGEMGVIHVHIDVREAMGANLVTQVCEFLKPKIAAGVEEKLGMAIVSNLADQKLTRVSLRLPHVSCPLGEALSEASLFAQIDPYRAVTHNKGLLNGMDGVVIATGNDWRAVEAGLHGFAARGGVYRGLSTWTYTDGLLTGFFEGPIPVGLVGGILGIHPGAQLCVKILNVQTSEELAQVIGGVGLLQNLGALRALVSGGIVRGHMALHADNLLLAAGASLEQRVTLKPLIRQSLQEKGYIRREDVEAFVKKGHES